MTFADSVISESNHFNKTSVTVFEDMALGIVLKL